MAREREIGRLQRLKIYANKMVDRIEKFPGHPNKQKWLDKHRECFLAVQELEHEIAASSAKEARQGGARIEVPLKKFDMKPGV